MADEFTPTQAEIEFLKAKRATDEASKVDINIISRTMSAEDKQKVIAKIREVWKQ